MAQGKSKENSKKERKKVQNSILNKIRALCWFSLIPVVVVTIYSIYSINHLYRQYDRSVQNITTVNEYNVSFQTDMNTDMYYLIVESYDWDSIKGTNSSKNPYVLIERMRKKFRELRSQTDDPDILNDIDAVLKMLNNLEDRVDDIIANVEQEDNYDESMNMLHENINVLTGLIQSDIEDYIYLEASKMEENRVRISHEVQQTILLLIGVLAAIVTVILLISVRLSRKITEPIRMMNEMTEKFAGGDFSVRVSVKSGDELEILANSLNSMVTEISGLIERIRTEQKNAKDMELKLLQAQINPHFLYNTLDAIMWLTEAGDNEQAVSMLSSLSNFFRTTLSKGRDWITVAEEESHIRSYLEIQQFRYQDILNYEILIPEEMKKYYVMKLTLQPIVENALYHGIKNKRGMGHISVTGSLKDGCLIFRVADDGIGMTEEELDHFRKVIHGEIVENTPHGFGVANVEQRIQLNYGEEYGISAESRYGVGTKITVRIPALNHPGGEDRNER